MSVKLDFNYEERTAAMDKFSKEDIDDLQKWTQKLEPSKCVPKNLSQNQIVLFYHACYGDVVKSKTCIEKYYFYKRQSPEFFNHRSFRMQELEKASKVHEIIVLPGYSCDGHRVLFHRFQDHDTSNFSLENFCKLFLMAVEYDLAKSGPQPGYTCVYDLEGTSFGHLTRTNLLTLRKLFQYLQEASPIRIKGFHIVNSDAVVHTMMGMLKPFMEEKFFKMTKLYNKDDNLDKLYEAVPKSNLPSNYGGLLADSQTLHKQCMDDLRFYEPYFLAEEEQRLAAIPAKFEDDSLQGTFKKLDID